MLLDRVLVPLDGSETARRGLEQAAALLKRIGGEAVLLRAVPSAAGLRGESFDRLLSEEKAVAEDDLQRAADRLAQDGLRCRREVVAGDPADAVSAAAARTGAGLIVLCTHGRSGVRRWALGSVAERILRSTTVPVLLVRAGAEQTDATAARTILVPTDGSEASHAAAEPAESWAKRFGAEIVVLSVQVPQVPPASPAGSTLAGPWVVPSAGPPAADPGEAGRIAEALASAIVARGLRARSEHVGGDPARQIVERARSLDAGLIVMATHGRSGLDRWFMGSVTEKVLREAETPMLVVRSAARG